MSVKSSTLDEVLDGIDIAIGFELLIVDVEGHEAAVFEGFSLRRWKPKMLIVELCDDHPDLSDISASDQSLRSRIEGEGYVVVYRDAANTVFVRIDVWTASDLEIA